MALMPVILVAWLNLGEFGSMDRLASKHIAAIILVSVVVTAIILSFQTYIYYRQGIESRDQILQSIEISYLQPTAAAVFYFETHQLELISEGLVQLPYVDAVSIHEYAMDEYRLLLEKNPELRGNDSFDFTLLYPHEDGPRHIGKLTVYSSLSHLRNRILDNLRRTIFFNILVLFGMAAVVWWLASRMRYLTSYDPLTQLPNRRLFQERLQHAMAVSRRGGLHGALIFLDVDDFKTFNDTRGHDAGDRLLIEIGERIRGDARESDTVARLGGDEFVVMLENLSAEPQEAALQAGQMGETLRLALGCPYQMDGGEYHCSASLGIALFNGHEESVETLLKQADLAMYKAKDSGRNTLRFFDPAMQTALDERTALETDLRLAMGLRQFSVHYQPQIDSQGRVLGAEVLLRWLHPERGMVSPAKFIPLAEATGLIVPIGHWVLQVACRQLAAWSENTVTQELLLAVNVSAREFRQENFVDQVKEALNASGADPGRLRLELTESMVLDDVAGTLEKMKALKELGIGFALDDFGTGHSSLAYLTRLPLDTLKIDSSFVFNLPDSPNDAVVAQTIISMARSLGLNVVAEGVETEAQRDFLARHRCHVYQGFWFSRPVPLEEFEQYIAASSTRLAGE